MARIQSAGKRYVVYAAILFVLSVDSKIIRPLLYANFTFNPVPTTLVSRRIATSQPPCAHARMISGWGEGRGMSESVSTAFT